MLCEITIENVAVIEKATASFAEGFTVLTGETGAGKSIMIDSINAILGNRTSRDIVRTGAAKASIWASFANVPGDVAARLEAAGYTCDGDLLLHREITAEGKSSCRINGAPANAAMLREICGDLVSIHGQHDNQSLLNPARHTELLDTFAQNAALLEEYRNAYDGWIALKKELAGLAMDDAEKNRRVDLLRYECQEIEEAGLQNGEEETLEERRGVVQNAQSIMTALNGAYEALSGGDEGTGASTLLSEAARQVGDAAAFSPDLAPFSEALNEAYYSASEIASDIQRRISDFELGEDSLDAIEERLDLIYRLKQKYGPDIAAILAYVEKAKADLENIVFADERRGKLEGLVEDAGGKAQALAQKLTASREKAFEKLNAEIRGALEFLNMPGIKMALQRQAVPLRPDGQDELELYISTNPGEAPKPLAKIASGGELARIMLAIKSALADRDDVGTVIYDEIDTGISGMASGRIGKMLRGTAAGGRQVICVTHTAQVAAYAQRHLLIEKEVAAGKTYTHITELDDAARVAELARIVSGDKVTDISLENAREMVRMAQG